MIDVIALALACTPQVSPYTMSAIVTHESRVNPYVINVNGGAASLSRQPGNAIEAREVAVRLAAAGYNFDSGLTQINSENVRKFGVTWSEVFEPCANLRLGARVLLDCYVGAARMDADKQRALARALSCYNTGNYHAGFGNGYVARVYAVDLMRGRH